MHTISIELVSPRITDTQMTHRELFWKIPNFWAWEEIGSTILEVFGVFSADLSAPILVLWVRCPCFTLINHYFYKKLSLYIQIPNMYLGLGFEFGPQRIRDITFVSVVRDWSNFAHLQCNVHFGGSHSFSGLFINDNLLKTRVGSKFQKYWLKAESPKKQIL